MIVLGANVLSKLMRARPAPEVLAFDAAAPGVCRERGGGALGGGFGGLD